MPARAYVGVGSNIDAEHNVRTAVRNLARAARVVGVSTFYQTAPIGHPDDPRVHRLGARRNCPVARGGGLRDPNHCRRAPA